MSYLEWPNSKSPGSDRIYTVTWEDLRPGEKIITSTWTIPDGVTGSDETFNNSVSQIKIGGGTPGEYYDFILVITTDQQTNTIERTIRLKVAQR